MLTLQEQFKEDLNDVFFNIANQEFTTQHMIDGKTYNIVVDNQTLFERNVQDDIENVYIGDLLFYIKEEYLGYTPTVDEILNFDGIRYQVIKATNNFEVLEIILKRNFGV